MPSLTLPSLGKGANKHLGAWYWYASAAEVFAACAMAIFLPITLEQMAREVGFEAPEFIQPCTKSKNGPVCRAHIFGMWVDTASFSMYVKSVAVLLQALCIISAGPLADSPYWRHRLLVTFAYIGSAAGTLFLLLPASPTSFLPIPTLAALLTVISNVAYAIAGVCSNAFLPGLAREDPSVLAATAQVPGVASREVGETARLSLEEARSLLPPPQAGIASISPSDLVAGEPEAEPGSKVSSSDEYDAVLSIATSRLSSIGTAIGFFSGVTVLAVLLVPVIMGGGTTATLETVIGVSALWWGAFTVPAWIGLPRGRKEEVPRNWLRDAWKRVGKMVRVSERRLLSNLFTYLFAWIFLSDVYTLIFTVLSNIGFHTTTYSAVLYASSALGMSPPKIIITGILTQLAAVGSSIAAPRIQKRLGYDNLRFLLHIVLAAQVLPLYMCLGLVLPFGGLRTEAEMYVAGAWFGLLYGPFNSYSRAVYAELIPPGHESTFFSLFALTDKSASFIGPLLVGLISDLTGNIRYAFFFLLVMLAIPVPVLLRVDRVRGGEEAVAWAAAR